MSCEKNGLVNKSGDGKPPKFDICFRIDAPENGVERSGMEFFGAAAPIKRLRWCFSLCKQPVAILPGFAYKYAVCCNRQIHI